GRIQLWARPGFLLLAGLLVLTLWAPGVRVARELIGSATRDDEIRHDETRPDETHGDETRGDETRGDETGDQR
ncbi:MAG: hypothetical protein ACYTG6_18020, partial [Planctomycetota bacterium]